MGNKRCRLRKGIRPNQSGLLMVQQARPSSVEKKTRHVSVDMRGLSRVGARPSFLDYLVALWDYRQFIFYDARARVQSGHQNDRLGSAWLILTPLFNGAVFFLIFGIILNTSRGIENFIAYLVIGVFLFQISSRAIGGAARSIQGSRNVIQAFKFPRATLPVALNVREMFANVPAIITMLVIIIAIPPVEEISWRWFLLIPILGLQFVFNLGVGLILARLCNDFHDIGNIVPFVIRLWLYASAVFFSIDRFVDQPIVVDIMKANPLYRVLDMARDSLIYSAVPSWDSWIILTLWALAAIAFGSVYFWKAEESYGRE